MFETPKLPDDPKFPDDLPTDEPDTEQPDDLPTKEKRPR